MTAVTLGASSEDAWRSRRAPAETRSPVWQRHSQRYFPFRGERLDTLLPCSRRPNQAFVVVQVLVRCALIRSAPGRAGGSGSPPRARESKPSAPEGTGVRPAPIHGSSVPPHYCLDTHVRCAGHSTRDQGYGVSGGGAGPRRGACRGSVGPGTWIVARPQKAKFLLLADPLADWLNGSPLVRLRKAGLDLRLPLQDARDHRHPEVGVVLGDQSKGRAVLQLTRDRAALSRRPSLQELQQLPLVRAEPYRTVPKSTPTPPPSRRMRSDEWLAEVGR